jgi:acyl carrier protein
VAITDQDLEARVRAILLESSGIGDAVTEAHVHGSLWQLGMDSLASVEVMVSLETTFGFEFPDSWLRHATFGTIYNIMGCVRALTEGTVR